MRVRVILAAVLRGYKRFVSPLLPPACRFQPSCSEYAAEAVERFGAVRGLGLALWRLARCGPRRGWAPWRRLSATAGWCRRR